MNFAAILPWLIRLLPLISAVLAGLAGMSHSANSTTAQIAAALPESGIQIPAGLDWTTILGGSGALVTSVLSLLLKPGSPAGNGIVSVVINGMDQVIERFGLGNLDPKSIALAEEAAAVMVKNGFQIMTIEVSRKTQSVVGIAK
ncbi:MAG: hypothetical protein NT069_25905 [Planctomycetota bacterium]|nr:hypothetical protein [Planctomycetota bacterium]